MKNKELVQALIDKNFKISCAESCTGGLLASSIVEVPAASQVFDMSFVTYANEAKVQLIDVKEKTIATYGVVSEEVAREMAIGCAEKANANVGVGISGIAGPTGATSTKPIGMVCFGFYINGDIFAYTKQFGNIGRTEVRVASVTFVIDTLLELLKSA
ncbi:MAG: CinA family protein [Anaeroplasmataceae bacterium]|nr:CinA family protein [Anaeroplasmataceae bacterium]MDE6414426.1 CinA family protein [Anaeroplasmataceae bacterium]